MSKETVTSAAFEQTAYQRAELDAFRRMLMISEGTFSLSVVLCNSPALRDHLIEYITAEIEGIEVVRVKEGTLDIFGLVRQQIQEASPRAIFIIDMEQTLATDQRERVLQGLNVSREQWRSRYQCPVVFWIPDHIVELLSNGARDLWSWVSHHFEFVSQQAAASAGLQDRYAGNINLASNLDVHEKQFRIAELEQRIADAGDDPEGQIQRHVSVWRNELACLHLLLGEHDVAMAILKEEEEKSRQLGDMDGLSASLGNQALILKTRGDLDGAMTLHKEEERFYRESGRLSGLQASLNNQARILQIRGDLNGAMALLKEQEHICRQSGNLYDLQTSLGNQALILQDRGDLQGATALLEEQERICRQLGDLNSLSRMLGTRAFVQWARGDVNAAMTLLTEQECISRQLGNLGDLQTCLGNQALILKARGDLDGAMTLLKEVGRISRQLNNVENLALSLANQALVLRQMGRAGEALALAQEARQLAEQHGYAVLAKRIEPLLSELAKEQRQ